MKKLKFCLVVDAEADFYYAIPSPEMKGLWLLKWKINNILGKLYKYPLNRRGLINLVRLFKKYEFPANFAIVGHLYLKKCNGWPHFSEVKPKAEWFKKARKKDWYDFDPCSDYKKKPGFYLGDFIEKEMKIPYFSFGLHSFSHEAYFAEDEEVIESSLEAGIEAAKLLGVKLKIYDGPWHMINDINKPGEFLKILKNKGFKTILYAGEHKGLKANPEFSVKNIERKKGLNIVSISKELDGSIEFKEFMSVIKEINRNLNTNRVYCLSIHDFTWNKKGIRKLEFLIRKIKELEKQGRIEIINF